MSIAQTALGALVRLKKCLSDAFRETAEEGRKTVESKFPDLTVANAAADAFLDKYDIDSLKETSLLKAPFDPEGKLSEEWPLDMLADRCSDRCLPEDTFLGGVLDTVVRKWRERTVACIESAYPALIETCDAQKARARLWSVVDEVFLWTPGDRTGYKCLSAWLSRCRVKSLRYQAPTQKWFSDDFDRPTSFVSRYEDFGTKAVVAFYDKEDDFTNEDGDYNGRGFDTRPYEDEEQRPRCYDEGEFETQIIASFRTDIERAIADIDRLATVAVEQVDVPKAVETVKESVAIETVAALPQTGVSGARSEVQGIETRLTDEERAANLEKRRWVTICEAQEVLELKRSRINQLCDEGTLKRVGRGKIDGKSLATEFRRRKRALE